MENRKVDYELRSQEFLRLFQRSDRRLYGYILSLVPNIGAADEISQETNLRLWELFDQFDPQRDFLSWACTIAYYQVLKYRKTAARERLQFNSKALDLLSEETANRRDVLAAKEEHLVDCLSHLDDFRREALRLYYSLGMTAKAVAERLGRSTSATEQILARTRHTLHDCIERAMHRERRV
jgi:RNA polymerase sigma-70 factor (ECF subfamily)